MNHTNMMSEILQLSVNERIQLVEDIWDSIQEQPDELLLTENEKKILDQRLEALEQHPEQTISWDDVKANVLATIK